MKTERIEDVSTTNVNPPIIPVVIAIILILIGFIGLFTSWFD